MWAPTLNHPSFPFHSKYEIIWSEMTGLIYNFFNDKASDWGIMRADYYLTNSLPKLMVGTTIPMGVGGWVWTLSLLDLTKKGSQWDKWVKVTGRAIGEVVGTFGPGVVGLVGGMSMVGHKVSTISKHIFNVHDYRFSLLIGQEWRFIIYCVPILVLLASISAAAM